jgi:hypothetical protein
MGLPDLLKRSPVGDALKEALRELGAGRWTRLGKDLAAYLERNADRILADHFRRAPKPAGLADTSLVELCRARNKDLEYALYLAAYMALSEDQSIQSRDEFDEQYAEIQQAVWTLGERLQRPPTPDETRDRLATWVQDSSRPLREKIVLLTQLLLWSEWSTAYAPILWKALDRQVGLDAKPAG